MIRKTTNQNGNKEYFYAKTGKIYKQPLGRPLVGDKIPNGILGRFLHTLSDQRHMGAVRLRSLL